MNGHMIIVDGCLHGYYEIAVVYTCVEKEKNRRLKEQRERKEQKIKRIERKKRTED